MNNTLVGINSRITEAEEQINDLEDRMAVITAAEQNIKKRMKRNDGLRDLWDSIKHTNICIIGVPEGRERERTWENIWRYKSSKLPEHGKGNSQPSPGNTESPKQDKPKEEHTETHSNQIDKKIKDRDKILKATEEKWQITYKGTPIRLSADFSVET